MFIRVIGSSTMHGFWKRLGLNTALESFMFAVESPVQPMGPPDVSAAIRLCHLELLQGRIALDDLADVTWQLSGLCRDGSTHELALVAALYFLLQDDALPQRLSYVRLDARLLAQQWMAQGYAGVGVVARFEDALFERFS